MSVLANWVGFALAILATAWRAARLGWPAVSRDHQAVLGLALTLLFAAMLIAGPGAIRLALILSVVVLLVYDFRLPASHT